MRLAQSKHKSGVHDIPRDTEHQKATCETLGKHLDSMVWQLQNFWMGRLGPVSFTPLSLGAVPSREDGQLLPEEQTAPKAKTS